MRGPLKLAHFAFSLLAAGAAGMVVAQAGLSPVGTGLGLKHEPAAARANPSEAEGGDGGQLWRPIQASEFSLYGGTREDPPLGLRVAESYSGVAYSLGRRWSSSFEAGYAPESRVAPRSYSLTGRLHTAFGAGRGLSMGLKYRVYESDSGFRIGGSVDVRSSLAYSLAPSLLAGAGFGQGYQLQVSYQHSPASEFGLAFGRDFEVPAAAADPGSNGQRQLTFTGRHWLTPSWALSYGVLSSEPTSPLRIQSLGLRVGVRYRF